MNADSLEPKKLALLRILDILKNYSDYDHHLTQDDIIQYLKKDYDLTLERKAVSRNLSLLKEAGVEIDSDRNGSYLAVREFDDTELRILIDGVLSSRFISPKDSEDLIARLCALSSKHFSPANKHIFTVSKEENSQLLYNMDIINEAIERKRQIEFVFTERGIDKKRHKKTKMHVTPLALFLIEQEYLLLFIWNLNERPMWDQSKMKDEIDPILWAHPLRDLSDIRLLEEKKALSAKTVDAFKERLNIPKFIKEYGIEKGGSVYTEESGKRQHITFVCPDYWIGKALDYFGNDITIVKMPSLSEDLFPDDEIWTKTKLYKNMVKINAYATMHAMKDFVFQNRPFVIVLSPEDVKMKIAEEVNRFSRFQNELYEVIKDADNK